MNITMYVIQDSVTKRYVSKCNWFRGILGDVPRLFPTKSAVSHWINRNSPYSRKYPIATLEVVTLELVPSTNVSNVSIVDWVRPGNEKKERKRQNQRARAAIEKQKYGAV